MAHIVVSFNGREGCFSLVYFLTLTIKFVHLKGERVRRRKKKYGEKRWC